MNVIKFTSQAAELLTPDEKRSVKVALLRDGSLRGWHRSDSGRLVLWFAKDQYTVIGLPEEAGVLLTTTCENAA